MQQNNMERGMSAKQNINNAFGVSQAASYANANSSSVSIENRAKTIVTGVAEVVSATEHGVLLRLIDGTLEIAGNGLRVEKLSPEEKLVSILGEVGGLKYDGSKETKNIFKRIFK
jgi:sporulation protein YabP